MKSGDAPFGPPGASWRTNTPCLTRTMRSWRRQRARCESTVASARPRPRRTAASSSLVKRLWVARKTSGFMAPDLRTLRYITWLRDPTQVGFRHRCLALALEAYRREEISRGKLVELAMMLGLGRDQFDRLLEDAGLGDEPPGERGRT